MSVVTLALFVASSAFLYAQKTTDLKTGGGGSPHVRTDWSIDGATLSIEYRPAVSEGTPRVANDAAWTGMANGRGRSDHYHNR